MLRRLLLLACGLNCFAISGALAQETVLWRSIGQWQIRVDASLGYGCFLVGSYTRGTVLRIGIDQQSGNGYVMVGNEAWRSLQVGNQYDLALRFDNDSPWRGRATARRIGSGEMVFLYLSFDRTRFLVELARRLNLRVFYNGDLITQLPLHGTNAAVQEMIRCQRAADIARKNNQPQSDPFAGGGAPQNTPSGPGGGGGGGGGGGPSFSPSGPSGPGGGGGPGPSGPGPGGPSSGPGPGGPSSAPDAPSAPGGPTFRPSPGGQ
jgi:hypothetical protein